MNTVEIKNGTFYGKLVEGVFEQVEPWKNGRVKIKFPSGKVASVTTDYNNVVPSQQALKKEATVNWDELKRDIAFRFYILDKMSTGIINGDIRALIVSGAAGVGKTFNLEKQLKRAEANEKISLCTIKGTMSAVGLYETLWSNRNKGNILLIDDCDSIFRDEDAMNILKAALDTTDERWISWNKQSRYMEEKGIDTCFEYEGSIIFISNLNFQDVVEKDGRLAPHFAALMSRSIYLDLAIHSKNAIIARIEEVVENSDMVNSLGITREDGDEIVQFLKDNRNKVRNLSLRTVIKVASYLRTDRNEWQAIAKLTEFK